MMPSEVTAPPTRLRERLKIIGCPIAATVLDDDQLKRFARREGTPAGEALSQHGDIIEGRDDN